ncbi:hypothetical protein KNP414_01640 [Paenibacillus mucilaginosus KNP414]|uniref:Uncharacterized protein n=1 Tax=Paenibacillus mucilaginosus (strain KNP414) TaxID=1036673 RepID=F8FPH9_PAEMK|nr:hypothetical protein KNP414_01640 [Paenibacillus mucilaginosus KNP414]
MGSTAAAAGGADSYLPQVAAIRGLQFEPDGVYVPSASGDRSFQRASERSV